VDVDAAVLQRFENVSIDIHPDDPDAVCGKGAGGWQTDVAPRPSTQIF